MTKNVAVILSGCGHLDGAEIRESVITLLELDKAGACVNIFAPNIEQKEVVNHLTGQTTDETRNVLEEAARIARGDIKDLSSLNPELFDALVMPGGFGVAKNLSTISEKGSDASVLRELQIIIRAFLAAKKPIGAICIAPAAVSIAVKDIITPTLTLGPVDANGLIEGSGGVHKASTAKENVVDSKNNLISCAAYMTDESLSTIAQGIHKLIQDVLAKA
jgi:enhancing lycopene biosynthesis protein 2